MKNRLLLLLLASASSWYCNAVLPVRITKIHKQCAVCGQDGSQGIGSATLTIAGGTPPYSYRVNKGPVTPLSGTLLVYKNVPGDYMITLEDSSLPALKTHAAFAIGQSETLKITQLDVVNNECDQMNAGSIMLTTGGGISPVECSFNGGQRSSKKTLSELTPGMYSLVAQSGDYCPSTDAAIEIAGPCYPKEIMVNTTDVTHTGGSDGMIAIAARGGIPPFEYSINGGIVFQLSNLFTAVPSGAYTVVIRDRAGSIFPFPDNPVHIAQRNEFSLVTVIVKGVTSPGSRMGSIFVQTTSKDPAISYSLNGGAPQTSPTFTNLPAGVYRIVATFGDARAVKTVVLGAFGVTISTITQPTFSAESLKVLRLEATGGVAPYSYSIDEGVTVQPSPLFTDLMGGIYKVVVTDKRGAKVVHTLSLDDTL